MDRRKFAVSVASLVTISFAGCSSESSRSNSIDQVEYDEEMLVVSLEEDHNVNRLEVILESGKRIHEKEVGTETLVDLFDVIEGSSSFEDSVEYLGETLTVRAVSSEDESIGETDIKYSPEIEVTDIDINFRKAEIQYTFTNVGKGPVSLFTSIEFSPVEITPEHELISNDTSFEFPNFIPADSYKTDPDTRRKIVESGGSEQISIKAEPFIHDVSVDPEEYRYESSPHTYGLKVDEPIDSGEIPVDKNEATVDFEIEIDSVPSGLDDSFEGEIRFSGITGHRDSGQETLSSVSYTLQLVADDAEIVSFDGEEV